MSDAVSTDDLGIYETTGINNHTGKFKVPSLRNIAIRATNMHDGRFVNLEEVIEHYITGMQNHPRMLPFFARCEWRCHQVQFYGSGKRSAHRLFAYVDG